MERVDTIFFAAILLFVFAFFLSGVLPVWALDEVSPQYQTLDDLTRVVPESFESIATDYPEAFKENFGEVSSASFKEALRLGRDIYIGEACWHCHSQYIRPVAKEEQRWGAVSEPEEYNNALQMPPVWGTRRVGPDLTRQGGVHSNDWHMAHLWRPESTSPGSVMPRYPWMFEGEGKPGKRALALVTYLQWLGSTRSQVGKRKEAE